MDISSVIHLKQSKREWWRTAVILQIYPRSFKDSNADGNGDIRGITQSMDYIQELGVDAIWLTPIHASPWRDGGYDLSSYTNFNEEILGNKDDVLEMVQAAHDRGKKVIFDIVMNHTSDLHGWYEFSNTKELYQRRVASGYNFANDALANIYIRRPVDSNHPDKPPSNHIPFFGGDEGSSWVKINIPETDIYEWQYNKFTPHVQPDVDLRNPIVRAFMLKIAGTWIKEYGIDGIRVDVLSHLFENPDKNFERNPKPIKKEHIKHLDAWSWEQNLVLDEEVYKFSNELFRTIEEAEKQVGREIVIIGEVFYKEDRGFNHLYGFYDNGIKIPFNFSLLDAANTHGANATILKKTWDAYIQSLPEDACPNIVLKNHDQNKRLPDTFGPENTRIAMMMLLTLGHTGGSNTVIYMGDEIGMMNGSVITPDNDIDPQGKTLGIEYSRSHSRTGFVWDATKLHAGFSTGNPWLPTGITMDGNGVAQQLHDPDSMLNFTKNIIQDRKKNEALQFGKYIKYQSGDTDVFAFGRETNKQKLMIILNFSEKQKVIALPNAATWEVIRSTNANRQQYAVENKLAVHPHEGCILKQQ